jgi:hypothetical protein
MMANRLQPRFPNGLRPLVPSPLLGDKNLLPIGD